MEAAVDPDRQFKSDRAKGFGVAIPHPDFEDKKRCSLAWPTDEQWAARARQQLTIRRSLGRDATKTDVRGSEEADSQLFDAIRIDKDGPEFDDAEKSRAIGQLEMARVIEVERSKGNYRIALKVPGAVVIHELKVPTQRQVMDFGRAAVHTTGRRNSVETRVDLQPSAQLWDKLKVSVEGYASEVPIIHKDVTLTEVLMQIQMETEDDDPEA